MMSLTSGSSLIVGEAGREEGLKIVEVLALAWVMMAAVEGGGIDGGAETTEGG